MSLGKGLVEISGPLMRAWVRIPLLTTTLLKHVIQNTGTSGNQSISIYLLTNFIPKFGIVNERKR